MKAYRSVHGHMNLFRPELNLKRLNSSAKRIGLPEIEPEILLSGIERLVSIDHEWLPVSAPLSLYIRPNLIGTEVSDTIIKKKKKTVLWSTKKRINWFFFFIIITFIILYSLSIIIIIKKMYF